MTEQSITIIYGKKILFNLYGEVETPLHQLYNRKANKSSQEICFFFYIEIGVKRVENLIK